MSWLLLLVVGAIVNFLVAELFDWFPWLAERLIRRAVRKLPSDARDRYLEEWLAEFHAVPGRGISKLLWAIQILVRASKVCEEILGRSAGNVGGIAFAAKRVIDRVSATGLLMLLSPMMVCTALAVRLSSTGPVLFRQRRVGRDGKEFDLYKFRSMRLQPEQTELSDDDSTAFEFLPGGDMAAGVVEGDDQRTPIGRFLWRSSLDELPQLLNVLRGEMSIIGPRPERPQFVELPKQNVVGYDARQKVKPGITGWAQVHGLRGRISSAERLELDNYYIANWSLGLDLKILALTFLALLREAE
jgi:lipopolysaccharide/colanic/teichoic acid biosynthesis glycosyltransferase